MDDLVLDELVDFFQLSDEFALSTALTFDDELHPNEFFTDIEAFPDASVSHLVPLEPFVAVPTRHKKPVAQEVSHSLEVERVHVLPLQQHQQQQQHQQRRSKDAIRRSEYRRRQKEEKESLRQEIDELSAKLDTLQDSSDAGSISPSTGAALSSCLWKAIASRQKDYLHSAEKEQLQLRAAISSRVTLIEDLCGLLKKRLHDGATTSEEVGDTPQLKKRMLLLPTDAGLFETFIQELYSVYLQTDAVFAACESFSSFTKLKEEGTEYYQHADRQTLPFSFKQTCNSLWQWQLKHREADREIYEKVEDPDNIIAMKFRISSRRMGETVSLLQRVVVRRFQEMNRVIVVWKVFSEGEGLFRGMHYDETGWCIAQPSTNDSMNGTVLDTCFRRVPMYFSNLTSAPVVNEFTDLVVSTGDEENASVLKDVERMLLDDALANGTNK